MTFPNTSSKLTLTFIVTLFFLLNVSFSLKASNNSHKTEPLSQSDIDLLEFPLNLEYLEAEFFLFGSIGYGLDKVAPELTSGGPPPLGLRKAFLDPLTNSIIYQFGLQEIGHLKAIKKSVRGFPRPLMNLSSPLFGEVMNFIFGRTLYPPFDPYANSINYLIGCYMIPYLGLTGYVGANSKLKSPEALELVGSLLAVESGQDAVIRTILYERRLERVYPYGIPVQEFTNKISKMRNKLGKSGIKDEGLVVNPAEGAEGKTPLNILAGDQYSLGYPRTPEEILRIVYYSGDERKVGGFYPKGADGRIARSFLRSS